MKKRITAIIISAILLFTGVISHAPAVSASTVSAYDCLSDSKFAKAYAVNTRTIIPYTTTALKQRGTITYGASSTAWIDGYNDLLYVMDAGINNGTAFAKVSYPIGNNKRAVAYIHLSDLTANTHSKQAVSTGKFLCALRQNGSLNSSYFVDTNETCWLLSVSADGERVQILYPAGSGYRIAWAEKSSYEKYCGAISENQSSPPTSSSTIITEGNYKTVRLDFHDIQSWMDAVTKAQRSITLGGELITNPSGNTYYNGCIISGAEVLEYKRLNVKVPAMGPGAYTVQTIDFPCVVRYKLHKHSNKVHWWFTGTELKSWQECECGYHDEWVWEVPWPDLTSQTDTQTTSQTIKVIQPKWVKQYNVY